MTAPLRVIDAGTVGAVRSQALWHGIAAAMSPGDDPVLSFCRSAEPYVCVGYHRDLEELDLNACAALGLPVLRRQIGGGPVYLDADQLLFQLSMPASCAPTGVERLYSTLLAPAARALQWLGVDARLVGTNDIVAGGRKVSGTGAGQIGEGVVVVGNVMFSFPHERMAMVLRLPDERMRRETLRLMRSHVAPLPDLDEESVKSALRHAYASALRRIALVDRLRSHEHLGIRRWEQRIASAAWTAGPRMPPARGRQVKVRAGVWVYEGEHEQVRVRVSCEHGRLSAATVAAADMNGAAEGIARALVGVAADRGALAAALREFGDDGERVLAALEPGLVVR